MNRKYVVVKSADNAMAEFIGNRIFTKEFADDICRSERQNIVNQARHATVGWDETSQKAAEGVAKSFIKVYELVATELN